MRAASPGLAITLDRGGVDLYNEAYEDEWQVRRLVDRNQERT